MCELFGFSAARPLEINDYLREFASHSVRHPDGWGLAVFYSNALLLEKEPVPAYQSKLLGEILEKPLVVRDMLAHIRLGTRGVLVFDNTHPFVMKDNWGHTWTLAHNGTVFHGELTDPYRETQLGKTDSERILCLLIDEMNRAQSRVGRAFDPRERFALMDSLLCRLAPGNKLNLLVYDGELLYVHTNYADSLYERQLEEGVLFATVPLDEDGWQPVPFCTLLAFRQGQQVFQGTSHGWEYLDNPEDRSTLPEHLRNL